jgi:ribosomal protein S18 acetylase RimI-like enzyme
MGKARFVPYDDERHRAHYTKMMIEYGSWLNNQVYTHYGVYLLQDDTVPNYVQRNMPVVTSVKPPEGIIYIIEVDGEVAGAGRFDTFEEGICEVHNVWISPKHRRKGNAIRLMEHLEDKAKEFGFKALRLDTQQFNLPAINMYKKIGYKEIYRYREGLFENKSLKKYYEEKVYMEKRL